MKKKKKKLSAGGEESIPGMGLPDRVSIKGRTAVPKDKWSKIGALEMAFAKNKPLGQW